MAYKDNISLKNIYFKLADTSGAIKSKVEKMYFINSYALLLKRLTRSENQYNQELALLVSEGERDEMILLLTEFSSKTNHKNEELIEGYLKNIMLTLYD